MTKISNLKNQDLILWYEMKSSMFLLAYNFTCQYEIIR